MSAAAGLLVALGGFLLTTPSYEATSSIFLAVDNSRTAGELAQGSNYAENQVRSFAEVATKPYVLGPVIARLALAESPERLAQRISAKVPAGTALIEVAVRDGDPDRSADIANAIADQMISTVDRLSPTSASDEASVRATIVAPAARPSSWASPNLVQYLGLGLAGGLAIGLAQALIRLRVDQRIRSEADIATVTATPVAGAILEDRAIDREPVAWSPSAVARLEAYRRIRTTVLYTLPGDPFRSILVTSSVPSEGKSVTAVNLAVSLGAAGLRVLLVDADLRRPRLAELLGLDGGDGLATFLAGHGGLDELVVPAVADGVDLLPSGSGSQDPAEALQAPGVNRLLDSARGRYDLVLFDSPPILASGDALTLGRAVTGTLLVAGCGQVTRPQLAACVKHLASVGSRVVGVVLNKVDPRTDALRGDEATYALYEAPRPPRVARRSRGADLRPHHDLAPGRGARAHA